MFKLGAGALHSSDVDLAVFGHFEHELTVLPIVDALALKLVVI